MPPKLHSLVRPGVLALQQYWKPFVLIEACGLAMVLFYFKNDAVRGAADAIAGYKAAGGLAFVACVSAFSGAILPEIGKAVAMGDVRITRRRIDDIVLHLFLFAFLGIAADLFYTWLTRLFGDGPHLGPVIAKIAIDQLAYTLLFVLPTVALVFTTRACGWNPIRAARQVSPEWYLRRVVPLVLPCWCFWVPMTALMYSLPGSLTFCFAMFAQGAWALLVLFIARDEPESLAADLSGAATIAT